MNLTSYQLKEIIIQKAAELGFIKTGFAAYEALAEESLKLRKWLNEGKQADMLWIERGFDKRIDISRILPGAKSVISLAYNYYTPAEHDELNPKISRYAWGKDYHKILKPKLKELCRLIEDNAPAGEYKAVSYTDDGPVMDKVWAQKAGIGWMGKHTNIINPVFGSWFFLSEIITNIEFGNYNTPVEDMCGGCMLCISACPTNAITAEYIVDSNKCISYQTIENRGDIPAGINLGGWVFGCDVCQDVCPYNSPRYNHISEDKSFYPKQFLYPDESSQASVNELDSVTEEEFSKIFADSPVKRTKFKGWKRNLERFKNNIT